MTATMTAPPIEQVAPHVVTRIREGDLKRVQFALLGFGVVLLGLAWLLGGHDGVYTRFYFSYLTAYMAVLGVCLGALFFVLLQHITRAGWSVSVRRVAENIAGALPWMLLLFLPIVVGARDLWAHWMDAPRDDTVIAGKSAWLNPTFFFARVAIYFAIWIGLAWWFRRTSLLQDRTGDPALSLRMSRVAAPGIILFALTLTGASLDWVMSLNPHWFSTMFGVTYFSASFMAFFAFVILFTRFLGRRGYLREAITTEHYHDLGKLLFAFMVFWTYVNFSQYFLIWYANLPEETQWYEDRRHGGWGAIGTLLIFGHFLVPFAFLMSRHVKRNPMALSVGAIFLLVIHWLDMQYLVLPNLSHAPGAGGATHGEAPVAAHVDHDSLSHDSLFGDFFGGLAQWSHQVTWQDVACVVGMLAFVAGIALFNLRRTNLLPVRDPRLAESLHFQNH